MRSATLVAGRALAETSRRWVAIGAADGPWTREDVCPDRGSFGRFGVDVEVTLSGDPAETEAQPSQMPLSMLVAGWLRGQSCREAGPEPAVSVEPFVVDPGASAAQCRELGLELAGRLARTEEPVGVLVVADGATALSPSAPGGGERESAWALQRRIDAALGSGDTATLAALDADECAAEGVGGRAAWQVLAALAGAASWASEVEYAGAPFGVGYTVATWRPER